MELKPCPFCGSNEIKFLFLNIGNFECKNCSADVFLSATSEEKAIEAWNRRAADVGEINS